MISLDELISEGSHLLFLEVATGKVNYSRADNLVHALVLRQDVTFPAKCRRVGFSTWDEGFWKKPTEVMTGPDVMELTIY